MNAISKLGSTSLLEPAYEARRIKSGVGPFARLEFRER